MKLYKQQKLLSLAKTLAVCALLLGTTPAVYSESPVDTETATEKKTDASTDEKKTDTATTGAFNTSWTQMGSGGLSGFSPSFDTGLSPTGSPYAESIPPNLNDNQKFMTDTDGNVIFIDGKPVGEYSLYTLKLRPPKAQADLCVGDGHLACVEPGRVTKVPATIVRQDQESWSPSAADKEEQAKAGVGTDTQIGDPDDSEADNLDKNDDAKYEDLMAGSDASTEKIEKEPTTKEDEAPDLTKEDPETREPGEHKACRDAALSGGKAPNDNRGCINEFNKTVRESGGDNFIDVQCASNFMGPRTPAVESSCSDTIDSRSGWAAESNKDTPKPETPEKKTPSEPVLTTDADGITKITVDGEVKGYTFGDTTFFHYSDAKLAKTAADEKKKQEEKDKKKAKDDQSSKGDHHPEADETDKDDKKEDKKDDELQLEDEGKADKSDEEEKKVDETQGASIAEINEALGSIDEEEKEDKDTPPEAEKVDDTPEITVNDDKPDSELKDPFEDAPGSDKEEKDDKKQGSVFTEPDTCWDTSSEDYNPDGPKCKPKDALTKNENSDVDDAFGDVDDQVDKEKEDEDKKENPDPDKKKDDKTDTPDNSELKLEDESKEDSPVVASGIVVEEDLDTAAKKALSKIDKETGVRDVEVTTEDGKQKIMAQKVLKKKDDKTAVASSTFKTMTATQFEEHLVKEMNIGTERAKAEIKRCDEKGLDYEKCLNGIRNNVDFFGDELTQQNQ